MHQASLLGEAIEDSKHFGWNVGEKKHDWCVIKYDAKIMRCIDERL
jgi:hypothetical protein